MTRKVLFLVLFAFTNQNLADQPRSFLSRIWPFGKKVKAVASESTKATKKIDTGAMVRQPAQVSLQRPISTISPQMPSQEIPYDWSIALIVCFFVLVIGMMFRSFFTRRERLVSLPPSSIEPFFMPNEWQECVGRLYEDLMSANEKICIASYWLTHSNIIMALRVARKRNVEIEIIFDRSTPNVALLQQQFIKSGIKFAESNVDAVRMHHKFIVIDASITWVGSANLTGTAFSKNYENMMRVQSVEIARRYITDFRNLMEEFKKSTVHIQKSQSSKPYASVKPISEYQKRILSDFGIDCHGFNYEEAYAMIGLVKFIR